MYVREKCTCGAEFEAYNGGTIIFADKTSCPLEKMMLEQFRALHMDCPGKKHAKGS